MRKRIIALVLTLVLTVIPIEVFAGTVQTTLEAGFSDGSYGNYCTIQAGTSKTIQFYMGEDDGKNFIIEKKIPANESDFAVYDSEGNATDLVKLEALSNGKMVIKPSVGINVMSDFYIVYTGSKFNLNQNDTFGLTVTANKKIAAKIKASKVSGISLKASKKGITVTFKKINNLQGYEIYRSTSKKNGFKKIADIADTSFIDQSSLKKGNKYYYKVRGYIGYGNQKTYTRYSDTYASKPIKTVPKATANSLTKAHLDIHDKSLIKEAYIFGLSNNIKFKYGATGFDAMLNNIQYAFLIGDYELGFAYPSKAKAEAALDTVYEILQRQEYDCIFADLFCAYNNGDMESTITYENGFYCIYISIKDARITDEQIFINQKKAVEKIKAIAQEMRESGKIRDDMSQKEIAQVYYEYVSSAELGHLDFPEDSNDRGICMTEDTPYAFLYEKLASCLGHTSTYNQFLHYEGIPAYGAANWMGHVEGENGHIISYIICDGQEYFTDTTNYIPLTDQEGIEKHLIFRDGALEKARKVANYK